MVQFLKPIQQPPFQIYELLTAAQGTIQVEAVDASGGGGGALTTSLFADAGTTVDPLDQTGAIGAPFSTIQAAADALPDTGGAVFITAGDYTTEAISIVGANPNEKLCSLSGLAPTTPIECLRFHSDASCVLQDLLFTDTVASDDGLLLVRTTVIGNTNTIGTLNLQGGQALGSLPSVGSVQANGVSAFGYQFSAGVNSAGLQADTCSFAGASMQLSATSCEFLNCTFAPGFQIEFSGAPGGATFDAYSYDRFLEVGASVVNGSVNVYGALDTALINKTIAAIAVAGTLAYETISTVGTPLEGITTQDVVTVNPTTQLAAAGANAGGLRSWRVSAADTIELALVGVIAGGADIPFLITRVGKVA
jgi:hypothetical protein